MDIYYNGEKDSLFILSNKFKDKGIYFEVFEDKLIVHSIYPETHKVFEFNDLLVMHKALTKIFGKKHKKE